MVCSNKKYKQILDRQKYKIRFYRNQLKWLRNRIDYILKHEYTIKGNTDNEGDEKQ